MKSYVNTKGFGFRLVFPFVVVCILFTIYGDACETLPSSIHIIKEIYASNGQLERTCEAEVAVSKCEGACLSKVKPSASSHTGFIKDCQCCREKELRKRQVILNKCYDPDGKTLTGEKETFTISLQEPAECRCHRCGSDMSMK